MSGTSRIAQAADRLRSAYARESTSENSSGWHRFLRVLLAGPSAGHSQDVEEALESSSFASPNSTVQATAGQLVELLSKVPRGPQKASLIRSVGEWWLATFGDQNSPEWTDAVSSYRESLRRIRGLGPATVDELLLFVARLPVFPLNRGAIRVAVRHGWLDLPLDDDESQQFFVQGLRDAGVDPAEFAVMLGRVADAHCGREPLCEGCPLQPLLPPGGPLNPDSV